MLTCADCSQPARGCPECLQRLSPCDCDQETMLELQDEKNESVDSAFSRAHAIVDAIPDTPTTHLESILKCSCGHDVIESMICLDCDQLSVKCKKCRQFQTTSKCCCGMANRHKEDEHCDGQHQCAHDAEEQMLPDCGCPTDCDFTDVDRGTSQAESEATVAIQQFKKLGKDEEDEIRSMRRKLESSINIIGDLALSLSFSEHQNSRLTRHQMDCEPTEFSKEQLDASPALYEESKKLNILDKVESQQLKKELIELGKMKEEKRELMELGKIMKVSPKRNEVVREQVELSEQERAPRKNNLQDVDLFLHLNAHRFWDSKRRFRSNKKGTFDRISDVLCDTHDHGQDVPDVKGLKLMDLRSERQKMRRQFLGSYLDNSIQSKYRRNNSVTFCNL